VEVEPVMPAEHIGLPGRDLVSEGLADLERGHLSIAALLVAIGAPRLRWLGFDVPAVTLGDASPEIALYRLLSRDDPRGAHSRYNALVRRLVSFERALELERARRRRHIECGSPSEADRHGGTG
jgi:hypothetical protein